MYSCDDKAEFSAAITPVFSVKKHFLLFLMLNSLIFFCVRKYFYKHFIFKYIFIFILAFFISALYI